MSNQLPGATGLYQYQKVDWDLREVISILVIAFARKQGLSGPLSAMVDRDRFESLKGLLDEDIKVSFVGGGWYYSGRLKLAKEATELFSNAVESGDLAQRQNHHYSTAALIRWTAALNLDLKDLIPEFGFPSKFEVDDYFKAATESQNKQSAEQKNRDADKQNVVIVTGPVHNLNQGNDTVIQSTVVEQAGPDLEAILLALRSVSQDPAVPSSDQMALSVAVEQIEKNPNNAAFQGNWLEAAKATLEVVGAVPAAVTATKLILAFLGARM